jgi:hypothetical protein
MIDDIAAGFVVSVINYSASILGGISVETYCSDEDVTAGLVVRHTLTADLSRDDAMAIMTGIPNNTHVVLDAIRHMFDGRFAGRLSEHDLRLIGLEPGLFDCEIKLVVIDDQVSITRLDIHTNSPSTIFEYILRIEFQVTIVDHSHLTPPSDVNQNPGGITYYRLLLDNLDRGSYTASPDLKRAVLQLGIGTADMSPEEMVKALRLYVDTN